jgi:hypothetical protein
MRWPIPRHSEVGAVGPRYVRLGRSWTQPPKSASAHESSLRLIPSHSGASPYQRGTRLPTNHQSQLPLLLVLQFLPVLLQRLCVIARMSEVAHFRANNRSFLFFQTSTIGLDIIIDNSGLNEDQ